MSNTDTDHGQRSATLLEPFNPVLARVQYGLLGPCVDRVLLLGVGVGHYAALSRLAMAERSTSNSASRVLAAFSVLNVSDDPRRAMSSMRLPPEKRIVLSRPRDIPCLAQNASQSATKV